jgi:hypothetical protein
VKWLKSPIKRQLNKVWQCLPTKKRSPQKKRGLFLFFLFCRILRIPNKKKFSKNCNKFAGNEKIKKQLTKQKDKNQFPHPLRNKKLALQRSKVLKSAKYRWKLEIVAVRL